MDRVLSAAWWLQMSDFGERIDVCFCETGNMLTHVQNHILVEQCSVVLDNGQPQPLIPRYRQTTKLCLWAPIWPPLQIDHPRTTSATSTRAQSALYQE